MKVQSKKDWEPTHSAFLRLLNWLDRGNDSSGERYVEIRCKQQLWREFLPKIYLAEGRVTGRKSRVADDESPDPRLNGVLFFGDASGMA